MFLVFVFLPRCHNKDRDSRNDSKQCQVRREDGELVHRFDEPPTAFCNCSSITNTYAYTVCNSVTYSVGVPPTVVVEVECEVEVLVPMVLTKVR